MTGETEIEVEQEPTEQMVEHQQAAQQRAEDDENLREAGHSGSVTVDDFDIEEAVSNLSDDHESTED